MLGIRFPDCSKSAINQKKDNDVIICWHDATVRFFWCRHVSLVKCSYWSRFHVNIITGSGVITIFVYDGFDQKSENWKKTLMSFVQYLERKTNKGGNPPPPPPPLPSLPAHTHTPTPRLGLIENVIFCAEEVYCQNLLVFRQWGNFIKDCWMIIRKSWLASVQSITKTCLPDHILSMDWFLYDNGRTPSWKS